MDSNILNLLALFISFSLSILMALKMGRNLNLKKTSSIGHIPPGPWKLPIIGHIHHLVTPLLHQKLAYLARKHGPLMHLQLGEIYVTIVSSAEYAKEIMKTNDAIFASRPRTMATDICSYGCTNIAFAPYGDYWRQVRKICTMELLTSKRVGSFKPIRELELNSLVRRIEISSRQGLPFNITKAIVSSINAIISKTAFGNKCRHLDEFLSAGGGGEESVAEGFDIAELFPSVKWLPFVSGFRPKIEKLHRKLDLILGNIVVEHKEAKLKVREGEGEVEEDLVDILLKFQDGKQDIFLTDNNIKAIILDIFAGGSDTAAITINWAMAEMIKNPKVMKKAQDEVREVFTMNGSVGENYINELKYLKLVVKETLRLHPPAPLLLPRECGEACVINGYEIPIKSKVIIKAWEIARDPNYWVDPEKFYPERFIDSSLNYKGNNFEYIPFGAGRRICPGSTFGLINVELALALLLYHFDWKLPNGMKNEDLDMSEHLGVLLNRKDDLYLVPITPCPSIVT